MLQAPEKMSQQAQGGPPPPTDSAEGTTPSPGEWAGDDALKILVQVRKKFEQLDIEGRGLDHEQLIALARFLIGC